MFSNIQIHSIGKVAGVVLGLIAFMHPIGIAVGFTVGFVIDRVLMWNDDVGRRERQLESDISVAIVKLMAQLAKADGVVTKAELRVLKGLFVCSEIDKLIVAEIFNRYRHRTDGIAECIATIARITKEYPRQKAKNAEFRVKIVEGMVKMALADGEVSAAQENAIIVTAEQLNVDIESLLAEMREARAYARRTGEEKPRAKKRAKSGDGRGAGAKRTDGGGARGNSGGSKRQENKANSGGNTGNAGGNRRTRNPLQNDALDGRDPYEVLGASADDELDAIKKKYRKLVMKTHPDRVRAEGASEAKIKKAEEQLRVLNAAWEVIKKGS